MSSESNLYFKPGNLTSKPLLLIVMQLSLLEYITYNWEGKHWIELNTYESFINNKHHIFVTIISIVLMRILRITEDKHISIDYMVSKWSV